MAASQPFVRLLGRRESSSSDHRVTGFTRDFCHLSVSQSVKGNPHWQVGLQSPHAPLTRLPFIAAVVGKSWFRYYYYYSITSVLYTTTTSIYCTNCSWQAHNERMVIDVTHGLTLVIHTGFHNSLPVSKAFYWRSWKLSFFEMNNWIIQSCMLL